MNVDQSSKIMWLLSELEDPFLMFPVEGVADTISAAIDDVKSRRDDQLGFYGANWSVEAEHYHDEVGLLVGSVFVLGQAAITQTVSILSELRKYGCAESYIPSKKEERMIKNAGLEPSTNLSKIVIINAVANYFKHLYEWPRHWDASPGDSYQEKTISVARKIGMTPADRTDNLLLAHRLLEMEPNSSRSIPSRAIPNAIQSWREAWAERLYQIFELSDPLAECRNFRASSLVREV